MLVVNLRESESGGTYTPTTCFQTFPFPRPTDEQREEIAETARELNRLREGLAESGGCRGQAGDVWGGLAATDIDESVQ